LDLKNCPEVFYLNCKNANKKCKICDAGRGSSRLYYDPIEEDDIPHPQKNILKAEKTEATISKRKSKDKVISTVVRKALRKENKVLQGLADKAGTDCVFTVGSGRVNGDADAVIGGLRVEHKYRSNSKTITVTPKEWTKGVKQGVDAFVITAQSDDGPDRTAVEIGRAHV
jgi:hypothetical protein